MHLRIFGGLSNSALKVFSRFFPVTFLQRRITHGAVRDWIVRLLAQDFFKRSQASRAVVTGMEVEISEDSFTFCVVHCARCNSNVIYSGRRGGPEIGDVAGLEISLNGFLQLLRLHAESLPDRIGYRYVRVTGQAVVSAHLFHCGRAFAHEVVDSHPGLRIENGTAVIAIIDF